jgi:streptogramin lyase
MKILKTLFLVTVVLSNKINAQIVTTIVGSGTQGANNGIGTTASFYRPCGLTIDASNYIYVADELNHLIRKISSTNDVTTFAGSGAKGAANGISTIASFNFPAGVAVDKNGNVFVADPLNNSIRKVTSSGIVSTFAGNGNIGAANGKDTSASFYEPLGVTVDTIGNVYVADRFNNLIRKITPTGIVSTLAGNINGGSTNGIGTNATFNQPFGVAVDASGNVFVADTYNHLIRKITTTGVVSTLAGSGIIGNSNGIGVAASFNHPFGIAVDATGNIFVADSYNNLIRKISPIGEVSTIAGSGIKGSTNGIGTSASFNEPFGITVDANGNIYVSDRLNHLIRKISINATGVEELDCENTKNVTLYPNPATTEIIADDLQLNSIVEITDILGEVLMKDLTIQSRHSFSISNLPNGVYFLNKKKFIKAE